MGAGAGDAAVSGASAGETDESCRTCVGMHGDVPLDEFKAAEHRARWRRVGCALSVVVCAAVASGCNGGVVDRHALLRDRERLDSIACEGAVVADSVRRDRTLARFVSVHTGELETQASNLADALGSRDTERGIESQVRAQSRRAATLARLLERIADHPSDRRAARQIGRQLQQIGNCT
jgi:hypothetical protein